MTRIFDSSRTQYVARCTWHSLLEGSTNVSSVCCGCEFIVECDGSSSGTGSSGCQQTGPKYASQFCTVSSFSLLAKPRHTPHHTTPHNATQQHTTPQHTTPHGDRKTETDRHREKQRETEKEDRNRERQRETEKTKEKTRQEKKREDETMRLRDNSWFLLRGPMRAIVSVQMDQKYFSDGNETPWQQLVFAS